jgi:hypothetical protein
MGFPTPTYYILRSKIFKASNTQLMRGVARGVGGHGGGSPTYLYRRRTRYLAFAV